MGEHTGAHIRRGLRTTGSSDRVVRRYALGRAHLVATLGATVAIVLLAGGILVGCGSEDGYTGNPTGLRVAILGDSITNNAYAQVRAALDPTYQSRISDWIVWTFDCGLGEAQKFAPSLPDRVVNEYCTN